MKITRHASVFKYCCAMSGIGWRYIKIHRPKLQCASSSSGRTNSLRECQIRSKISGKEVTQWLGSHILLRNKAHIIIGACRAGDLMAVDCARPVQMVFIDFLSLSMMRLQQYVRRGHENELHYWHTKTTLARWISESRSKNYATELNSAWLRNK